MRSRGWNAATASVASPGAAKNSPSDEAVIALPLPGERAGVRADQPFPLTTSHGEKMPRVYAAAAALTVALAGLLKVLSPPALVALVYTR